MNALAQAAGAEAIRHQDDVAQRVERTIVERVFVEEGVRDLGLETPDSHANFSWIDLGDADEGEVVSALGDAGVVVRPGTPLGGPGHIRVSYGTREQNQRFVDGLDRRCRPCGSAPVAREVLVVLRAGPVAAPLPVLLSEGAVGVVAAVDHSLVVA